MKRFTNKGTVIRFLCVLFLAVVLLVPGVAQAADTTVSVNKDGRKDYTAKASGETIVVSLNGSGGNIPVYGKPSWVSYDKDNPRKLTISANTGTSVRKGDVVYTNGIATWTIHIEQSGVPTYTVNFNSCGGTTVSPKTVTRGGTYGYLATPSRTGFTFAGWFTDGGIRIIESTTVSISSNITLYAHWNANTYVVSFNSNGGSAASPKSVKFDNLYGTLPTPSKTGYTFAGWCTSGGTNITANSKVTTASDHTLNAIWIPNQVTIKFFSEGKEYTSRAYTVDAPYGGLPAAPSKTGHKFNGWFTAQTGGTKITENSKVPLSGTTLYAQWSVNQYKVTFNSNGGSAVGEKTVTYNSTYGTLATPSREGYTFAGWYTSASGGTKITSSSKVTTASNHTLYAIWNPKDITVKFVNEGKEYASRSYTVGTQYGGFPDNPTKSGNAFDGWFTAQTGGTKVTKTSVVPTKNTTLYSHWLPKYRLTFDSRGGSSVNAKTIVYSRTYGTLDAPVKTGYTFAGWYTAASGGTKITANTTVNVTANQTLYAHWKVNTYTITFNSRGGSAVTEKTVTYGKTYGELETPTRAGCTFRGWFTETSGGTQITAETNVTITADQTLYAQWKANKYTVSFNSRGGSAVADKSVTYNKTYGTLETPVRAGYSFVGWYTAASGGTQITAETKVAITANQMLYAHWKANNYTVSFNSVGGSAISKITVTFNKAYGELGTPKKTGYTFAGWFTEKTGGTQITAETTVKITADQTLYAHWTAKRYTVVFDSNGGSEVSNKKVTYGKTYGELATPERTGYRFLGWFTAASGGTQITAGTTVSITATQTLYAHWTLATYMVTFDSVGGSAVAGKEVTYSKTYGTLVSPKRDGFTFVGWYTQKRDGTKVTANTTVTATENHTLYAHWKGNKYTVSFDSKGGSGVADKTVTFSKKYGDLETPERPGFIFEGWFTEENGETQITSESTVQTMGDHTLYAHWSATVGTVDFQFASEKIVAEQKTMVPWACTVDFTQFFKNSDINQYPLMKASLEAAMAAFDSSHTSASLPREANIEQFMKGLGFGNCRFSYPNPTYDSIGYAIGSRKITDPESGKTATLILVAIRGAGYEDEWGGDFNVYNPNGSNKNHYGFELAANQVLTGLQNYTTGFKGSFEDTVKLWVVGYSRAAATANLVCSKVIDQTAGLPITINYSNVFGYGFETPRCTTDTNAHDAKYNGIKSFINLNDFVPMVPMNDGNGWNFERYGTTYSFPGSNTTNNSTMQAAYKQILSQFIDASEVQNELSARLQTYTDSHTTQGSYVSGVFGKLAAATVNPKTYYDKGLQAVMIPFMAIIMNGVDDDKATIEAALKQLGASAGAITLLHDTGIIKFVVNIKVLGNAHRAELCLAWVMACPDMNKYPIAP